jgi:hypothetical protein
MERCTSATARRADFALIDEDAEESTIDGCFKISVSEEDVRRFSSQLERDPFNRISGCFHNLLSHHSAAREGDLVHLRMLDQGGSGCFTKPRYDIHYPGRQSDVGKPIGYLQHCQRRLLCGLQHARAASGKRRRQFPGSHQQRIVPGNNLPGNSYRFLEC